MRKIIDYGVSSYTSIDDLRDNIKENLVKGWEPVGGIACTIDSSDVHYLQAMVKYEEPLAS